MPPEAVDLVSRLLQYSPNLRSAAVSITSQHSSVNLFDGPFISQVLLSDMYLLEL